MHILDTIRMGGETQAKAKRLCSDCGYNPTKIGCEILKACGYDVTNYGILPFSLSGDEEKCPCCGVNLF